MEKFYSSKTLLKIDGGGDTCAAYPTSPPGCVITKDGLKFKRYVVKLKIPKAVKARLL